MCVIGPVVHLKDQIPVKDGTKCYLEQIQQYCSGIAVWSAMHESGR